MKRIMKWTLVLSVTFFTGWFFLSGCTIVQTVSHGVKTMSSRVDPDYDQLEKSRSSGLVKSGNTVTGAGNVANEFSGLEPYWTGFRGPGTAGTYAEQQIQTDWPEAGPTLLWKQPCGGGYGSFAVANGMAFTLEQRREKEALVAYDLATGAEIWVMEYEDRFNEMMSGEGPRSTPTFGGDRVYSLGANGRLHAVDPQSGSVIWQRDVLNDTASKNLDYGVAASPLYYDEKVYVVGGKSPSNDCVFAYNAASGDLVWSALSENMTYVSPMLYQPSGAKSPHLLVNSSTRLVGMNPQDGEELWTSPWKIMNGMTCSQPLALDNSRLLVSGGYGAGAKLIQVGKKDGRWAVAQLWKNNRMKTKFNAGVIHDGHVYGLDEGILACLNIESGKRIWKGGRFGYGQVILAEGHLICTTEKGDLVLVKATPESFQELCRIPLFDGTTWNVPALAHGLLLLRNPKEMACFDLRL